MLRSKISEASASICHLSFCLWFWRRSFLPAVWSVETENATLSNLPEGDRDAPNAGRRCVSTSD